MATAGFITILTEALPAGLLPQMGSSLNVSDAMVGQLVTLYAIGSLDGPRGSGGTARNRLRLAGGIERNSHEGVGQAADLAGIDR